MKIKRNKIEFKSKYSKVLNSVVQDKSISHAAFRLFMIISNCSTEELYPDKRPFTPTTRLLADMLNLSDAGLDRCIGELKDRGYIVSTGSRHNTVWVINYSSTKTYE